MRRMGIGVVMKTYCKSLMPGFRHGTVGYHIDDGKIFDGREMEGKETKGIKKKLERMKYKYDITHGPEGCSKCLFL